MLRSWSVLTRTYHTGGNMFKWKGSPGKMDLLRVFGVRVCLTRWNNLAGYSRKVVGVSVYRQSAYQTQNAKGQIVVPLRRFKCGRKNLYLKVSWGY